MNADEHERDREEFIEQLFRRERQIAEAEAHLPDPTLLYRRAVAEERHRTREKAMRPIAVMERISYVLAAGAGGALLSWNVSRIDWSWPVLPKELPQPEPVTALVMFSLMLALFVSWLVFAEE